MKSGLFVVPWEVPIGPLSVYFTSFPSCISPHLPWTSSQSSSLSKTLDSLLGFWQCLHPSPPLTWLVPTSSTGFNSDVPSSGGLSGLTKPGVGIPLGVPIATGACCKDTLALNLITCLLAFLHLLLPYLASFFSLSSLSPPPSLESILFVQMKTSPIKHVALLGH